MKIASLSAILAICLTVPLFAQEPAETTLPVLATMDLYRAGGYGDGSNGIAPAVYTFPARRARVLKFASVSGSWTCQNGLPEFGADGETSGQCLTQGAPTNFNSIGPLSGYNLTGFCCALAGVFLEDALPTSPAPALRFYVNGLTGAGAGHIQRFEVPDTATHLYLGYIDNCMVPNNTTPGCYSDNVGTLTTVFTIR